MSSRTDTPEWASASFDDINERIAVRAITDSLRVLENETPDWQLWNPTYASLTVGNGTVVARYRVLHRYLQFHWQLICGSTTVIGTNPKVVIPPGWLIHNDSQLYVLNPAMAVDASANVFRAGVAGAFDAADNVLTTRIIFDNVTTSATSPFTWATGDILAVSGGVEVVPG